MTGSLQVLKWRNKASVHSLGCLGRFASILEFCFFRSTFMIEAKNWNSMLVLTVSMHTYNITIQNILGAPAFFFFILCEKWLRQKKAWKKDCFLLCRILWVIKDPSHLSGSRLVIHVPQTINVKRAPNKLLNTSCHSPTMPYGFEAIMKIQNVRILLYFGCNCCQFSRIFLLQNHMA